MKKEENTMTVLRLDECRLVNEIVDFIVTHHGVSVAKVKEMYNLTAEEYDMISELMMPAIRYYNKAKRLESGIRGLMHKLVDFEDDDEKEKIIQQARELKAQGFTNATIGKKLNLSEASVKLYTMEDSDEIDYEDADNRAS